MHSWSASVFLRRNLVGFLIIAGVLSSILLGCEVDKQSAVTKILLIGWGAFCFAVLRSQLSLLLSGVTIFVAVVLGWGFQLALSPFSIFGWKVTYNDILFLLCMLNWAFTVFSTKPDWPHIDIILPLIVFLVYLIIPTVYTLIIAPNDARFIPGEIGAYTRYLLILPFRQAVSKDGSVGFLIRVFLVAIVVAAILIMLYYQGVVYIPVRDERGFDGGRVRQIPESTSLIGFCFASAVLIFGGKNSPRVLAMTALVSSLVLLMLSLTRSAMGAMFVGLGFLFIMTRIYDRGEPGSSSFRRWLGLLALVGILSVCVTYALPEVRMAFVDRFTHLSTPGSDARVKSFTVLLPYALSRNPVTGIGIGRTFTWLQSHYDLTNDRGAHSTYVFLLVKTGVIGLLLYVNLQYRTLRTAYNLFQKSTNDAVQRIWISGMSSGVLSVLALSAILNASSLTESVSVIYSLFIVLLDRSAR